MVTLAEVQAAYENLTTNPDGWDQFEQLFNNYIVENRHLPNEELSNLLVSAMLPRRLREITEAGIQIAKQQIETQLHDNIMEAIQEVNQSRNTSRYRR